MSRPPRLVESPISPKTRLPLNRNAPSKSGSQRPGPPHHRASAANLTLSIASTLDTPTQVPAIPESSNNAISTLLQNPIVRTGLSAHSAAAPSSLRFPTSRDITPVTLTSIPQVDNAVFRSYLDQAGGLYDVFRRSKEAGNEAEQRPSSSRTAKAEELAGEGLGLGMHRRLSGSPTLSRRDSAAPSLTRTDSTDSMEGTSNNHRRRSSGGTARRNPLTVAPLSTIPSVYFDEDFRLENPRTFDVVSERSEIAPPVDGPNSPTSPGGSGKKALAANAILQEKLSWYMDTVEIHLISSISTASTSFFAALGSLRGLQEEAAESVDRIRVLRKDLGDLDQGMAVGGLDIIAKKRRRENLRRLTDAVEQLEFVTRCIGECEDQVNSGEIDAALTGLTDVELLISGDQPKPRKGGTPRAAEFQGSLIDLRSLKALGGVSDDISHLRRRIGEEYEKKFIEELLKDLNNHVDHVPALTTFARLERASNRLHGRHRRTPSETQTPAFQHVDEPFRATLRELLKGLAKSDWVVAATTAYREAIKKEFKNLIRRQLPSSSDDDAESTISIATQDSRSRSASEKSSILARNLRAMDEDAAIDMLKKIYSNVAEGLRRLGTQARELLDITSSLENPPPMISPQYLNSFRSPRSPPGAPGHSIDDRMAAIKSPGTPPVQIRHEEIHQALDLQSLLGQAVKDAQDQITKVLKVRGEQTRRMELPHFLQYFTLNRLFADECEAISGQGGTKLRNVVNEHIKLFVSDVADAERSKLVQKMDADKWDARDFNDVEAERLKRLMQAGSADVESWTKLGSIFDDDPVTPKATGNGVAEPAADAPASKDKVRAATIGEEKYILPESAMVVAAGIESYETLLVGLGSMGTEICSSLLDYLKLFDSRSQQLILGAGATRTAGLRNITTKHLALSSQALSFVVALLHSSLRSFAARHLPKSSALLDSFDKVEQQLRNHQEAIHDKLAEIMKGRATAHANTMRKIDWDAAPKDGSNTVHPFMETLMKETSTLHKVLTRHLPADSVGNIMRPVLAGYEAQWTQAFSAAVVKSAGGKERLLRDAEFFRTRISKIEGASDMGEAIVRIANDKTVQEEPKPRESVAVEAKATEGETPDGEGEKKE